MPERYLTDAAGLIRVNSYTVFLAVALLVGLAALTMTGRTQHTTWRPGARVDAALGGLVGGLVLGRLGHVMLSWSYFATHTDEITHIGSGGLNWHGALIGGLIGLVLVGRWRGLRIAALLDDLTPLLPVFALAAWYGCWAWACGYGAEVDTLANHPAFTVTEARDIYGIVAPRYHTHRFGLIAAGLLLGLALLLTWRDWLRGVRFWLVLALLSAAMFSIGFVRGDAVTMVAGWRLDQGFDLGLLVFSICAAIIQRHVRRGK